MKANKALDSHADCDPVTIVNNIFSMTINILASFYVKLKSFNGLQ